MPVLLATSITLYWSLTGRAIVGRPTRFYDAVRRIVGPTRPSLRRKAKLSGSPLAAYIPLHQRHLSNAVDEAIYHQLISSSPSTCLRTLALSSSLPHAGDWLNMVPSTSLGLHLQDCEFRCCLRYWLGVPLHNNPYTCPECHAQQIPSETTKWGVEVTATG